MERVAAEVAVMLILALGAYRGRALDAKGTLAALLIGVTTLHFGGVYPFLALLIFMVAGVVATRYRFSEKLRLGIAQSGLGVRSWRNVLGNGLPAVIFIAVEYITRQDVFWAATFASIATASGDTLASELGKVLGKRPRLITTLKPVSPGENGAVSIQGELAALLGILAVGVFSIPLASEPLRMLFSIVVGGIVGVNLDSLIGATLEERGITDNNSTNFIASFCGGCVGALTLSLLM
ncbi:MAG: hypothetical protein PWQ95_784 [Thermococcaceae archaeon]|nr:hypothetical protein [Thermococcaceae archaeon]